MSEKENMLAIHPFFDGLDGSYLERLAQEAEEVHFKKGDCIFREGDAADKFYLIQKGKVNIITDVLENQDFEEPAPTAIQTIGKGEVLGWSWFVPPHEWQFEAKAIEAVDAIAIDGFFLRDECEAEPMLGYEILKRLMNCVAHRLRATRMELAMHHSQPFTQVEGG